jgi:hypothetical protein
MSTQTFFENQDIAEYIQANGQFRSGPPWVFVHVPQAIEGWFRERMADALQPDAWVRLTGSEQGENYDAKMLNALKTFAEGADFSRSRLISGHIKVFQLKEVKAFESSRRLTVFRDPIDRLLADFNAQADSKKGDGKAPPSADQFLEFAKDPANQNVYLQFLCPKNVWKPRECIAHIMEYFDYIGIWEDATMSLKLLYALLGMRITVVRDGNSPDYPVKRGDLSPEIVRAVARLNGADYEIYRFFHDRFVALKDKFFELSDHGTIFREVVSSIPNT